ncbi:SPNS3 isoform 3 [Pongo abelii]|uniref:SPNS3 isoform 3 n=1 Tax=Pongo abelii TaxID=9601 RepID=A0A2J8SPJ6_PONAB|nr:SPNS3 isoform 3 [Pongo abelii]
MAGGMSAECPEPGLQGQSPGPGRQCPPPITPASWSLPRWRAYVAAAVLCYINLLNYMNWFIIAGVLLDIQEVFQISDNHAGLLQTVFLALLPVPGHRGHWLGQLLHHRAHRPGRPLREGPAHPRAGRLLHLYPRWKWSGLRAGVGCDDADWELALGPPNHALPGGHGLDPAYPAGSRPTPRSCRGTGGGGHGRLQEQLV